MMRAGRDERTARSRKANGDVAQLGECLTGSQKVTGSIPVFSTTLAGASSGLLTGRGGRRSCLRMLTVSSLTVDQVTGVRSSSWAPPAGAAGKNPLLLPSYASGEAA